MALRQLSRHVLYLPFGDNDRPNIGLIRGEKSSLAVDGGNSENQAKLYLAGAGGGEKEKRGPDYLVLTHPHWDHVFGAYYFSAKTVCQTNTAADIEKMAGLDYGDESLDLRVRQGKESAFSRANIKNEHPVRGKFPFPSLDITFDDSIVLHLGAVDCVIRHMETVHHPGACTIYIPQDNILFLGDCLWMNMSVLNWYYSLGALDSLAKELKAYHADYYIDSHCDPIPQRAMFRWLDALLYSAALAGSLKGDKTALLREVEKRELFKGIEFIPLDMVIPALAEGALKEKA